MYRCHLQVPASPPRLHATQAAERCPGNKNIDICMYRCHQKGSTSTRCLQKVPTSALHLQTIPAAATQRCRRNMYIYICDYVCIAASRRSHQALFSCMPHNLLNVAKGTNIYIYVGIAATRRSPKNTRCYQKVPTSALQLQSRQAAYMYIYVCVAASSRAQQATSTCMPHKLLDIANGTTIVIDVCISATGRSQGAPAATRRSQQVLAICRTHKLLPLNDAEGTCIWLFLFC